MSSNGVSSDQRFTPSHPCPVCGSHDRAPRGRGERCAGYLAGSGNFAFCGRVESAETVDSAAGPLYKHRLDEADRRERSRPTNGKASKVYRTPSDAIRWAKGKLGRLAGHSVYHDAGGRAVLAVYRFDGDELDPKTGKPSKEFRPVGRVPDGWINGDKHLDPLPLYHLPELAEADLVLVCEGEKAADAAKGLGLVATTPAHGAESPKRSDWSPLASKTVVILPDNDPAGRKSKAAVVELLAKLDPAPTVKVLDLPGLPEKGDVVEWIADGGTREALLELIEAAPVVELPRTSADGNGDSGGGRSTASPQSGPFPRTEFGLAERFVCQHGGDVRFCHPWNKWLVWDGRRWKEDETARVRLMAKATVRALYAEAARIADEEKRKDFIKWAIGCEKKKAIDATLALATFHEGVPIVPAEMDRDPWLLNCENGVIDLRSGRLRPHDRGDLLTKLCPVEYDPAAECPLWIQTLRLFLGDDGLIGYWQRLCGYAITGVIRDHILPIAYGTGSNGKSTILGALLDVLGPDYALKAPPDLLMAKDGTAHPTERAALFGKRLILAIETEDGRRLNETLVKELTGGDTVTARRMREDFWSFVPTHKIFLATNHKPAVRGTDHGIWRRIKLLPFTITLPDDRADKSMPERLKAEAPGILAWCVRGCLDWQRDGLGDPAVIAEATGDYRQDEDVLGTFIAGCCAIEPEASIQSSDLYAAYKAWSESNGQGVLSLVRFGKSIEERGIAKDRKRIVTYQGIRLLRSGEEPREERWKV